MTVKSSLAVSVAARLHNRAKEAGDDYQNLLLSYCLERFLFRLGASSLRERFVLKGATLLRVWSERPYRATRDVDLLRRGDGGFDAIRDDIRVIVATPVPDDAVTFDSQRIEIEAIRAEGEYAGARATLLAHLGTARLPMQIDMGVGDAVWPQPQSCKVPALLDLPAPDVLAYPREAVVAEKLEAMVVLGDRNSRIKDFFDLHYLGSDFEFDRATLTEAVRRTFERRRTPILTEDPIGLTTAYWDNPSRPAQIRAFARRAHLNLPDTPGKAFTELLRAFLVPVLDDLRRGVRCEGTWRPGGPWR